MLAPKFTAQVTGFGPEDYAAFTRDIQLRLGIRLAEYKTDQMQRRLATVARQHELTSFGEYSAALARDSDILAEFLGQMTINVTELMRNPELFEQLTREVLPPYVATRKAGVFNIWSAGCSYGAEACTVAMLMSEASPGLPLKIDATDLDLAVLAKANALTFCKADMVGVSPERRLKNFVEIDDNTFMTMPSLKRSINFSKHDLLADSYPPNTYDLILCRNVVIYFTEEAKDRIFRNFWSALRPGGVLFVGATERLSNAKSLNFELVKPFFYRAINK